MGSSVDTGSWSQAGLAVLLLCLSSAAQAQLPIAPAADASETPAGEPAAPASEPRTPTGAPAPPPAVSEDGAPPRLDPPPSRELSPRPSPPKAESAAAPSTKRKRSRLDAGARPPRARRADELPKDFVLQASPWVDLSLTSFWMGDRSDNFLNLGVQVGGYFVERLRVSGRVVAPLEETQDEYDSYDFDSSSGSMYQNTGSRSVSVLYGVSLGLILSSSKTFLFAPGVTLWRTDVNDYGNTAALSLPFEWTTHRHLRVGFELSLGHSFGGSVQRICRASSTPCGMDTIDRPSGTAVLLQYSMGYALSAL